jgi:hypothetical protein
MLGMEWKRDIEAGTSILHQRAFTEKLLKVFGFWKYGKPTKTPQSPGTLLINLLLLTPCCTTHIEPSWVPWAG